jgi:hypothetical protein
VRVLSLTPGVGLVWSEHANPHAPQIAADGGIADVAVILRSVGPNSLPAPMANYAHGQLQIGAAGRIGFARPGQTLTLVSPSERTVAVRGRGAAFFGLTLPTNTERRRPLAQAGWVELSSASGDYWARAWVYVSANDVGTCTDTAGQFTLPNIPTGTYELCVWMPHWATARQDRDPETGLPYRQWYRPAIEITQRIDVPTPALEIIVPAQAAERP